MTIADNHPCQRELLLCLVQNNEQGQPQIKSLGPLSGSVNNSLLLLVTAFYTILAAEEGNRSPDDSLFLFDFFEQPIDEDRPLRSIPAPGVVLCIAQSPGLTPPRRSDVSMFLSFARKDPTFHSYMIGVWPHFRPSKFDVFVSYASDDERWARELSGELNAMKVTTFLAAKDIGLGEIWTESIRGALRDCLVGMVLVTQFSKSREWVIAEMGALWVLGAPIIPALRSITPKELPFTLPQHQGIRVETLDDQKRLVESVRQAVVSASAVRWRR